MAPELEIGIVTKDRPDVLKDTLLHLEQLDVIENVIVVDGSSNDETRQVCEELGAKYFSQEREGGRCAARNELLEECGGRYLAFIDDDTMVSENWFEVLKESFKDEKVVGVTGKLEGEEVPLEGIARKVRNFLFGGREVFGEILDNGVINGDFFYNEEKEVDHLVGCNMAFEVETLRDVNGFNEDYDVGNAYREETEPSYRTGQEGKLVYKPEVSVDHLEIEDIEPRKEHFYRAYMTKYFLSQNNIVRGLRGRTGYFVNKIARHGYFSLKSMAGLNPYYLYYLYGELRSFIDFVVLDRTPIEYV